MVLEKKEDKEVNGFVEEEEGANGHDNGDGEGEDAAGPPADFKPVPVTLLSGFLGSGKTTLLKNILEQREGKQVAVLVNDMAELNIDASLVKKEHLLRKEEKVVEMQNGCICCTLRQDLLVEMTKLALVRHFDAVVIESTGISEPQQVAETFTFPITFEEDEDTAEEAEEDGPPAKAPKIEGNGNGEEKGADKDEDEDVLEPNPVYEALKEAKEKLGGGRWTPSTLNEIARLDTCVTVVDCKAFSGDLADCQSLVEKYQDRKNEQRVEREDDRDVAQLLIDQIEFANVVLVNKTDLVTEEEAQQVERTVRVLNPSARVHRTQLSRVPLSQVMGTGLFDMREAEESAGWLRSLTEEVTPESEEYGIGSFVYRARAPFHPGRLAALLESILMVVYIWDVYEDEEEKGEEEEKSPEEKKKEREEQEKRRAECAKRLAHMKEKYGHILRSKGVMWVAGRDLQYGEWSQAGTVASLSAGGIWPGCFLERMSGGGADGEGGVGELLPSVVRDRRQEVVVIGSGLRREAIVEALDGCLLREEDCAKEEEEKENGEQESPESWKLGWREPSDFKNPLPPWPDAEEEMAEMEAAAGGEGAAACGHRHGRGNRH